MFRSFVKREHVDLDTMCRLCLCDSSQFPPATPDTENAPIINPDHSPMIDIFHNPAENGCSLPLRIMACLGLAVQPTDALPKHLCPDCRQLLEQFYWFRKRAHNSDTLLRRHQRLCNAGKPSRVFAARAADEDDDEEDADCEESRALFEKWSAQRGAAAEVALRRALDDQQQRLEAERLDSVRAAEERVEAALRTQILNLRTELEQKVRAEMEAKWRQMWESNPKPAAAADAAANVDVERPAVKRQRTDDTEDVDDSVVEFVLTTDTEFEIAFEYAENGEEQPKPQPVTAATSTLQANTTFVDDAGGPIDGNAQRQIVAEGKAYESCEAYAVDDQNDADNADEESVVGKTMVASPSGAEYLDEDQEDEAGVDDDEQQPLEEQEYEEAYNDNDEHQLLTIDELDEQNAAAAAASAESDGIEHYIGEFEEEEDDDDDDAEASSDAGAETIIDTPVEHLTMPRRRRGGAHRDPSAYRYRVKSSASTATQVEVSTGHGNEVLMVELLHGSTDTQDNKPTSGVSTSATSKTVAARTDYGCPDCPERYTRLFELSRHMAAVHEDRMPAGSKVAVAFVCEHCDRPFPSNSSLVRHMRTHTGEKPFGCEVCGRAFIQKEILKRHMQVHTGERPFACTQCEKTFTQRELLRQHVNRQHSEEPVIELRKCGLCSKSFYHASGLSRHMLLHTGKKFVCEFCKKPFNDKSALRRHVGALHGEGQAAAAAAASAARAVKMEMWKAEDEQEE